MKANQYSRIFRVSAPTIWISSLFIGIMAAIPKFLTLQIKPWDLVLDALIAMLFSIFVWYLNIYLFPSYSARSVVPAKFISKNLGISLLMGIPVMAVLTLVYRLFGQKLIAGLVILILDLIPWNRYSLFPAWSSQLNFVLPR